MRHALALATAAAALMAGLAIPAAIAEQAPAVHLVFLERSDDGICLYEAAVRDMLVAVLVRQGQGDPPCKPELTLP